MEQVQKIDAQVENVMSTFLKKPTLVKGVIYLVLMLYAARVAPKPPQAVLDLFENQYFKLFFFALILWTAQFSPSTSLLIAISFLITMNYFGEKALWEFMENVDSNGMPTAPSKEVAMETSAAIVENQVQETPIVQTVTQEQEAIVIQPTVEGTTVEVPTVVVAPVVVSNENGEKVLITPEVTLLEVKAPAPTPAPEVPESAPTVVTEKISEEAPKVEDAGCYPIRKFDMSNVMGYDAQDTFGTL